MQASAPVSVEPPRSEPLFLLRATALVAALAAVAATVAPGLRGIGSQSTVDAALHWTAALAYWMCGLLITSLFAAATRSGKPRIPPGTRTIVIGATGLVVALSAPALAIRILPLASFALAFATITAMVGSSAFALTSPTTRAVGIVVALVALAALTRLGAWEFAHLGGERANPRVYQVGRVLATVAFVLEGLAQLVCVSWFAGRGTLFRRGSALAAILIGALVVTRSAAEGSHSDAAPWEVVLHAAFGSAAGAPEPLLPGSIAAFISVFSILFGFVAVMARGAFVPVLFAASLALLSRASFDVPLRALAACAAAAWLIHARSDAGAAPQKVSAGG